MRKKEKKRKGKKIDGIVRNDERRKERKRKGNERER